MLREIYNLTILDNPILQSVELISLRNPYLWAYRIQFFSNSMQSFTILLYYISSRGLISLYYCFLLVPHYAVNIPGIYGTLADHQFTRYVLSFLGSHHAVNQLQLRFPSPDPLGLKLLVFDSSKLLYSSIELQTP